ERWLGGEPIVARPAGNVERAVKWMRRRPAAAALLAVLLLSSVVSALMYRHAEIRRRIAVRESNEQSRMTFELSYKNARTAEKRGESEKVIQALEPLLNRP